MKQSWYLLLVLTLVGAANAHADAPDFNAVAPILNKYCVGCHNATDREGKLVLESYDTLSVGGEHGAVITPGQPDLSRLVRVLDGRAEPAMPPEGNERPTKDEIAVIAAWIAGGARGPSGEPPDPARFVSPQVELLAPARQTVQSAAFSPKGELLALGGYRTVRILDAATQLPVRELTDLPGNVNNVHFISGGDQVMAACGEPGLFGEVRIYNVNDGGFVRAIRGHKDCLYDAALSPDGKLLATAGYDYQTIIWDVASGSPLRTLSGHNACVYDLDFHPGSRILASASGDRTVKLWDATTGERLDTLGQSLHELYAVAFSPDGTRLAAGGVDNRIRVWSISADAKEGTNPILHARYAHEGAILRLAFSPDGQSMVSTAEDRTVKIWNPAEMAERHLLETQSDWPAALAVAPDSQSFVVARLDGSFTRYRTDTGAVEAPAPPPKPELATLMPRGVQRGQTARVVLKGKNLAHVTTAKCSDGRVQVAIAADIERTDEVLVVDVTAPADMPRAATELSVVSPGGESGTLWCFVDDLPQRAESETEDPGAIEHLGALPLGVWGVLQVQGDQDTYSFEADAGETIVFDLVGKSLWGSELNPVLTISDANGRVLASSNDYDGEPDPLLAYTCSTPGTHRATVKDLAAAGSEKHFYRLTLGKLPFVTGCFPLSVPAGTTTRVALVGYNLPADAAVEVAAGEAGEAPVAIDAERYRSRRALNVVVGTLPESLESEPNDTSKQANAIVAPGVVGGRIDAGDREDVDVFRFESPAGKQWIIETDAARRGSPLDTRIEVSFADGRPVPRVLMQAVRDSNIEFRPTDSNASGFRLKNWEEMDLNQFLYVDGEVCKLFRMPQGPDSDMVYYTANGKRRGYFDTTPTAHAVYDRCYIVEPRPIGASLVANGLPVFTLNYENDDDSERQLGTDSKVYFQTPVEGTYLVRVSDVRGLGGDRFAYRLTVREPRPDFNLSLNGANPTVAAGSGQGFSVSVDRIDGFDGDVEVEITGLPPGFSVTQPLVIQAGHNSAQGVINAAPDAAVSTEDNGALTKVVARAEIDGHTVVKEVGSLGRINRADKPKVVVHLVPDDPSANAADGITIAPGTMTTARLKVERNGFNDRIQFGVDNLPHGVIVDNIGLNGVLIPEGETERQIFLTAAKWVPETSRPFHAVAQVEGNQASRPLLLHVRRPTELARP